MHIRVETRIWVSTRPHSPEELYVRQGRVGTATSQEEIAGVASQLIGNVGQEVLAAVRAVQSVDD